MTDIVESLKRIAFLEHGYVSHTAKEARDEIERLRTHNHALELGLRVAEERLAEAERAIEAALPNSAIYLDPPDGGSVTFAEQLQRMSQDAARYRWLREADAIDCYDKPGWDDSGWFPLDSDGLDAAIDAAMAGDKP